jgi:prepilin signal peptidase PulO-like enzyme (type II secretory pathway)
MYMVLIILVYGLIFGSFVNALVWRVYKNKKWWGNERSICPKCKHKLKAKDLIPVISWLALRGKCNYCKKPISIQYPAVELATALIFTLSYIFWPYPLNLFGWLALCAWLLVIVVFVALSVYDLKYMLLPNKMVAFAVFISLVLAVLLALTKQNLAPLISAIFSAILFYGVFALIFYASKAKWIGGGDVKLAISLGLIVATPLKVVLVIFIASVIGTIISLPLIALKKYKLTSKMPFGPLLMVATIIVFLFGEQLINWYLKNVLYL